MDPNKCNILGPCSRQAIYYKNTGYYKLNQNTHCKYCGENLMDILMQLDMIEYKEQKTLEELGNENPNL
jgi:hypothetical protein